MQALDDLKAVLAGEIASCGFSDIPYAQFLGFKAQKSEQTGELVIVMPYSEHLIGTPQPARLHGGTVAALLEFAGSMAVTYAAAAQQAATFTAMPKPISVTTEFMRGGAPEEMFARAEVLRLGRRVGNVRALAWQGDPNKVNATATMTFLMPGV